MTNRGVNSKSPSPSTKKARSAGRPAIGVNTVGPAALIDAACDLLKTMPPEKVTRAAVARHANVNPALINYHFKDRSILLRAAARTLLDRFQLHVARPITESAPP